MMSFFAEGNPHLGRRSDSISGEALETLGIAAKSLSSEQDLTSLLDVLCFAKKGDSTRMMVHFKHLISPQHALPIQAKSKGLPQTSLCHHEAIQTPEPIAACFLQNLPSIAKERGAIWR